MVLFPRFRADVALDLVEKERVTCLIGVPTMWMAYLAELKEGDYDISSLRLGFTAGALCPPGLAEDVERRMGCRLHIAYGMAETAGYGTMTRSDDPPTKRLGTVGRALTGIDLAIVDREHNPVPPGERGEIAVRGQALFSGYYERPEATDKALDSDGWFYTGDLGALDEEGYLRVAGRSTDMILRGGHSVYAAEVETCLLSHPDIVNVAVIGLPDPFLGETVHAQVILREGASVTDRELIAFCRREIANYKVPDQITFVVDFPLSSLGKVQKYLIRDQVLRELGAPVELGL
jgi:acyl-CoA synthetase (AMP-forming)/AMP-acid ligase II